jgi:hypothetical protein
MTSEVVENTGESSFGEGQAMILQVWEAVLAA